MKIVIAPYLQKYSIDSRAVQNVGWSCLVKYNYMHYFLIIKLRFCVPQVVDLV